MGELDVRKLRLLQELDERGTVNAVAEALHLTPSAVSQQIAALRREVGVPLIEPVGRRVQLTGAARVLLRHTADILARLEHAQAELAAYAEGRVGDVRVAGFAATLSGLVVPAVVGLRESAPHVNLRLVEADPPESYALLIRGDVDVVVALESQQSPPATDRRFHRVPLLADRFDLALPVGHPLAGRPDLRMADLQQEAWIFAHSGTCRDISLAACAAAGFTPDTVHTIGDMDAAMAAVAAGLGVALVPRLACVPPRTGVVIQALEHDRPRRHVFAAVREGSAGAPHIAAVLDALVAAAAKHVAGQHVAAHSAAERRAG